MNNWKKRVACLVLTAFVFSLFPPAVFAQEEETGVIEVMKVDANTAAPLEGASFLIRSESGEVKGFVKTDKEGKAKSEALEKGRYEVVEVTAPEGYLPSAASRWVDVKAKTNRVVCTNEAGDALVLYATDHRGNPLEGVTFRIRHAGSGALLKEAATDESGHAVVTGLPPGAVDVTETVVPEGYQALNRLQSVTLKNNGRAKALHFSHSAKALIQMECVDGDTGKALTGATYHIMRSDGHFVGNFSVDQNGEALSGPLSEGTYYVKETGAPEGYLLNTTTQTLRVGKSGALLAKFFHVKGATLKVRCLYKDTAEALAGVTVLVENEAGHEVFKSTTGSDGMLATGLLKPGRYAVKILGIPPHVTAIQKEQSVTVTSGEEHNAKLEFVKQTRIRIHVTDALHPERSLEGARYEVKSTDGRVWEEAETDSTGTAVTNPLPEGYYLIHQLKAPKGYLLSDTYHWKHLSTEGDETLNCVARAKTGVLLKALTMDGKPVSGVTFDVIAEGSLKVQTLTTNEAGVAMSEYLEGGRYLVKETGTPKGMMPQMPYQKFSTDGSDERTLTFYQLRFGSLKIVLRDQNTKEPLEGAFFEVRNSDGNYVAGAETDENGTVLIPSLPEGTYTVLERRAPEGFEVTEGARTVVLQNEKTETVNLTNTMESAVVIHALSTEGQNLKGAVYLITDLFGRPVEEAETDESGLAMVPVLKHGIYLVKEVKEPDGFQALKRTDRVIVFRDSVELVEFFHKAKGVLRIEKTDAKTGAPLAGAKFRLETADGTYLGDYETKENGTVSIPDLKAGTYHVTETKAPEGYLTDGEVRSVSVSLGKVTVLGVKNHQALPFVINNRLKEDGSPLAGSTFRIVDETGAFQGDYTTDESGNIYADLREGHYTVVQLRVPKGIQKLERVWKISVMRGENRELLVENNRISCIRIHFVDGSSGEDLSGVKVRITDHGHNDVDSLVSSDDGTVDLTGVLKEGCFYADLLRVPTGYLKDTEQKKITVKTGETTEILWKLYTKGGQISFETYAGEDSKWMNIRKGTRLTGALYEVRDQFGKVVSTVSDNGRESYSAVLKPGDYTVTQIRAPHGFGINQTAFRVSVKDADSIRRVRVYNPARGFETTVSLHGSRSVMPKGMVKYYANVASHSTGWMQDFYLHWKIPTDALRCVTIHTGTYMGPATNLDLYVKTNRSDYRLLARDLNSKVSYVYGLSERALGLERGEYVTDIRMVFHHVPAGFQNRFAPVLSCYALSHLPAGYEVRMRAETGGFADGFASSGASGSLVAGAADSFVTGVTGGFHGWLPPRLPAMGY